MHTTLRYTYAFNSYIYALVAFFKPLILNVLLSFEIIRKHYSSWIRKRLTFDIGNNC